MVVVSVVVEEVVTDVVLVLDDEVVEVDEIVVLVVTISRNEGNGIVQRLQVFDWLHDTRKYNNLCSYQRL